MQAGEALGCLLQPGDFLALFGELGSGKTLFVRGVAVGLGCEPQEVHSPSFTLVNEYACGPTATRLAHIDLYRIRSEEEVPGIGWDEYVGSRYVVAVEWAERAQLFLPPDHVSVRLQAKGAERRRVCAQATGPRSARILRDWMASLGVHLDESALGEFTTG
jgi:tRNA threonylcarbamoyladenosine biosynthesis protein TsaE